MDTDTLRDRIINGALADIFGKALPKSLRQQKDEDEEVQEDVKEADVIPFPAGE
jgi:hypothetical protein